MRDGAGYNSDHITATKDPFDYVSKGPTYGLKLMGGKTYFNIVQDTLTNVSPFGLVGAPVPTDGKHFTAAFESQGGYYNPNLSPYLDGKPGDAVRHPTMGIGINLDSISGTVLTKLVADVKVTRPSLETMSSAEIIAKLKTEAKETSPPQSLTKSQAQQLFDLAYTDATTAAQSFAGASWAIVHVQWVLSDLAFIAGGGGGISGFTQLQAALQSTSPDYVRGGFELLDSKRSASQIGYARSLADYEYLVGSTPLKFKL